MACNVTGTAGNHVPIPFGGLEANYLDGGFNRRRFDQGDDIIRAGDGVDTVVAACSPRDRRRSPVEPIALLEKSSECSSLEPERNRNCFSVPSRMVCSDMVEIEHCRMG